MSEIDVQKLLEKLEEVEEEVSKLEIKIKILENKRFNPYKINNENFYSINKIGQIEKIINSEASYKYGYNKYNSRKYAELRQREIELQDKLWQFSYENGWEDRLITQERKYYIHYSIFTKRLATYDDSMESDNNRVYFISNQIAEMAIEKFGDEIINILEERRSIANIGNDEITENYKEFPKEETTNNQIYGELEISPEEENTNNQIYEELEL